MSNNVDSGSRNSRTVYRTKRKKTNTILNSLIIIVLLLIIFVAYLIFSSGNNNASSQNASAKQVNKQSQHSASEQKGNSSKKTSGTANNTADSNSSKTNTADTSKNNTADSNTNGAGTTQSADQTKAVVTQGGSSPDVSKTIQNPDWKPVGTSQTGKHTTTYETSSVDWQEMLSAISYATGIDQSNMTVWFLGRDDSNANGAIGTVEDKSSKQKYRVYIQWVDGQGWEPTKVEQLTQ